jgi:hypothetical protein
MWHLIHSPPFFNTKKNNKSFPVILMYTDNLIYMFGFVFSKCIFILNCRHVENTALYPYTIIIYLSL